MNDILRTVLVNRAIVVDDDRLLVLRRAANDRHNPSLWEFPGGKLDVGENIPTGLEREVREETGLTVEVSSLTYVEDEPLLKSHGLYVALFHVARVREGLLRLSDEHSDASWDTVDEALGRQLTPESRRAIIRFAQADLI